MLGAGVEGYPEERFVDVRQIDILLPILTARLDLAVSKGCDGIEPDLDDTYNGYATGFPLTMADQLAFNRAVADAAHHRGLSIGLKNGASADGSFERAMAEFTDWALNEECNTFDECAGYSAFIDQNRAVFQVEYMRPNGTAAGRLLSAGQRCQLRRATEGRQRFPCCIATCRLPTRVIIRSPPARASPAASSRLHALRGPIDSRPLEPSSNVTIMFWS